MCFDVFCVLFSTRDQGISVYHNLDQFGLSILVLSLSVRFCNFLTCFELFIFLGGGQTPGFGSPEIELICW